MPKSNKAWFAAPLFALAASAAADPMPSHEITHYPYVASAAREAQIRQGHGDLKSGMTQAQVRDILGEPDEIRDLHEARMKAPALIGHTEWYVIRRLSASGSVNDKQEALVRLSYDLNNRVSRISAWGL